MQRVCDAQTSRSNRSHGPQESPKWAKKGRARQEAASTSDGIMQDSMLVVVVVLAALADLWIAFGTLKAKAEPT